MKSYSLGRDKSWWDAG